MRSIAVVLAGGMGSRMGGQGPKQLMKIAGKTMLERSLLAFERSPEIDDIIVVMEPLHLREAKHVVELGGFRKVSVIVEGGATRSESSRNGLGAIADSEAKVLIHDAARPLVSQQIIAANLAMLERFDAVSTAVESVDTVAQIDPHTGLVQQILERSGLRRHQTPQSFRLSVIRDAFEKARQDPLDEPTDDVSLVLRYLPTTAVAVVAGDERNFKVTRPIDLFLAAQLLEQD